MKQNYLYNHMVRVYNRSRGKLEKLIATGKNLRRQNILTRRIARLFNLLSGMQTALKAGAAAVVLTAGMALFQPNAAQAQITFGPVQNNPFGLGGLHLEGTSSCRSTMADLDGDGDLEVYANSPASGGWIYTSIWLGNGDGTFGPRTTTKWSWPPKGKVRFF